MVWDKYDEFSFMHIEVGLKSESCCPAGSGRQHLCLIYPRVSSLGPVLSCLCPTRDSETVLF